MCDQVADLTTKGELFAKDLVTTCNKSFKTKINDWYGKETETPPDPPKPPEPFDLSKYYIYIIVTVAIIIVIVIVAAIVIKKNAQKSNDIVKKQ